MKWVDQSSRNLLESEADDDDEAALLTAKRVPADQDDVSERAKKFKLNQLSPTPTIPPNSNNSPALNVNPANFKPLPSSVGRYSPEEINPLLQKAWISRERDKFYTTDIFPGNVPEHSLIIPSQDAINVINFIHYNFGHPTVSETIKFLRLWKLHIVNFKDSIASVYSSCKHCLTCRDTYHPQRSYLPVATRPMQILMADFIQPDKAKLPSFLIFRDRYSGLTEGRAVERLDSFEIKQFLIEWIARYGSPQFFFRITSNPSNPIF